MTKIIYSTIEWKEDFEADVIEVESKKLIRLDLNNIRRDDGERIGWIEYSNFFQDHAIQLNPKYDYILGRDKKDNIVLIPIKKD